jgi:glycerol-3-phosphate O-acyltransferase
VPVALNYERVLEDSVLIAAREKGARAFRLRWWMVARYLARHLQLRLTGRFTRFGFAAVSFGRPLSLDAFLAEGHADPTEALGRALMERVAEVLPVLPTPLVCEGLLAGAGDAGALGAHLEARAAVLGGHGHPVHRAADTSRAAVEIALRMLSVRNAVTLEGEAVKQAPGAHDLIAFYARTLPDPPRLGS